jgi:tetraacyldisaccharide 4'-kinase
MAQQHWIKILLTPFSWLYGIITDVRNATYDQGLFKSQQPDRFTICVGNLTVGGTGKTPTIEHLVSILNPNHNIAILSRGYGRKTKGFFLANAQSTAEDIGDEPLQYFKKYKANVTVAVCENRVAGAQQIIAAFPETKLILLDDAFQHRAIQAHLQVLLNDYNRPFYKDLTFPAGRLREKRSGAHRADAIIVTKCPTHLTIREQQQEIARIRPYTQPNIPIFFSVTQYDQPISYNGQPVHLNQVIVVAGIAAPKPFIDHVKDNFNAIDVIIFEDHHNYTTDDFQKLIKNLKSNTFVVTTEKDMVKLNPLAREFGKQNQFAYIPIKMDIRSDHTSFDQWILQRIPHQPAS